MFFKIISLIFDALFLALLIRVLLSWIPHSEDHPVIYYIYRMTEPMLSPFRNIFPTWKVGIDISPIFALLALSIVKRIIFNILF
jgi:YggT family protein